MRCIQIIGNRQCRCEASAGESRCHKHKDQSLHARVARRCRVTTGTVEAVANALVDEMGWDEIDAFNRDFGQSVNEDAGGYLLRKIGRLIGAKPKHEITTYKEAFAAMLDNQTRKP